MNPDLHFDRLPSDSWPMVVLRDLDAGINTVLVTVIDVKGSTPRNAGSRMLVTTDAIWQTIGGGALEFEVMRKARKMLANNAGTGPDKGDPLWRRQVLKIVLGPDMGQCCGGRLSLLLEKFTVAEAPFLQALCAQATGQTTLAHPLTSGMPLTLETPVGNSTGKASIVASADKDVYHAPIDGRRIPLFIYGAGHVSRALIPRLDGMGFNIFLVDIECERFPKDLGKSVQKLLAKRPETIALHAPDDAVHLVMTHDHCLDQAICLQVLSREKFAFLGLIGSATKRARFTKYFIAAGIAPALLDLLVCPIGISEIGGKHPNRVALSIAAQLAIWQQSDEYGVGGVVGF